MIYDIINQCYNIVSITSWIRRVIAITDKRGR